MSAQIVSGRDVQTSEAVWIKGSGHEAEQALFREEVRESTIGKKFAAKYGDPFDPATVGLVTETIAKLYERQIETGQIEYISSGMYLDALKTLMYGANDRLTPLQTEEPQEQTSTSEERPVPRDKNGRPLSASQIAWGEMARWSETASSQEIKERRKTDPAFASFYRKNVEREFAEGGVADGALNLNAPVAQSSNISAELRSFAEEYRRTPAAEVRRLSRADSNPYGYITYNKNIAVATAAGLLN